MATTVKLINELYSETISKIAFDTSSWKSFLNTAAMNYTNSFSEQLLIYSQRPEAILCADINTWNNRYNRIVNKGTPGIGLLTEEDGHPYIKYVWGLNDTHSKFRNGKKLKVWKVPRIYENQIIESLENKFGELDNKDNFINAVKSVANNLTEDNYKDYLTDLIDNKDDSSFMDINAQNIEILFKRLLSNSISYMILKRSDIEPYPHYVESDFNEISFFKDISSISKLGTAISDISEMGIREIYLSLKNIRISEIDKIRTFDKKNELLYTESANENRRDNNELQESEWVHSTRSRSYEGGEKSREVFNNEIELSQESQEGNLRRDVDEGNFNRASTGDRRNITEETQLDDRGNEAEEQYNREIERGKSDELDRANEFDQESSRRNDKERINLLLDNFDKESLKNHYIVVDEKINQILAANKNLKKTNRDILNFFNNEKDISKRIEFLKEIFNYDDTIVIVKGKDYSYKAYNNGVLFWKGDKYKSDCFSFIEWKDLTYHYDSMILLNQLVKATKEKEQLSIFDVEDTNAPELEFTDAFIDRYLFEESFDRKRDIYNAFGIESTIKGKADYLRDLYGIGGTSYSVNGSGIGTDYDSKGLEFYRGYNEDKINKLFSWNYIANRISKLIENGNYFNEDEQKIINALEKFDEEIITSLSKLDEEHNYTVARIMNDKNAVELHYNEGVAFIEYGTKITDGYWENEIENINWFDKDMSEQDLFSRLEDLFIKHFEIGVDSSNLSENYYGEYNDEIDLLDHILHIHKIDHIVLKFDENENIVAMDDDNVWHGKDFYDFLFNELFVYDNNGNVPLIDNTDFNRLKEYRKKYESEEVVEIIDNHKLETSNLESKKKEKISDYFLHSEVPYEERINYHITDNNLGSGTKEERFRNNINAIKVLKTCEKEDRYASKEEQEILSKYVGWGGLADAFDKTKWGSVYNELHELFDEKEFNRLRDTVNDAFYTPPVVIKAMYKALENMGLNKGNILEPSCGIGNFIGLMPNNEKLKIYGVEIDEISGNIARQLYQKSSIAIKGFEEVDYSDSFFDVVIGNVPFGNNGVYDKKYDKYKFLIHDYFFAKAIDKVRPGGIIAFVTSRGTMDKESNNVRKYIAQRADLLGAIRLPNNTFEKSAGTLVTTDIIFLQKREAITDIVPEWVDLSEDDNGIRMNSYFVNHPEMIMGTMKLRSNQYGGLTPTCYPNESESLEDSLNKAVSNIHAQIKDYKLDELEEEDNSIEAYPDIKNFSYTIVDDKVYYRENSRMYPQELSLTAENRIKGLIELRDLTRELIYYQLEDYSDDKIKEVQDELNQKYDKFTKDYGLINSRGNSSAFSNDSSYFFVRILR